MAKYSFELKQKVVQAYLSGEGGYKYLANKYAIVSECMVRKWVNAYKKMGSDGLIKSRKNQIYSFDFKLHIHVRAESITLTREESEKLHQIDFTDVLIQMLFIKKLQQIHLSLSIMKLMIKEE